MSIIQDVIEKKTIRAFLDSGVFEKIMEEERGIVEKLREIKEEGKKINK